MLAEHEGNVVVAVSRGGANRHQSANLSSPAAAQRYRYYGFEHRLAGTKITVEAVHTDLLCGARRLRARFSVKGYIPDWVSVACGQRPQGDHNAEGRSKTNQPTPPDVKVRWFTNYMSGEDNCTAQCWKGSSSLLDDINFI
ncbi:hypothetical protein MHYP_G00165190 [Metynnis hypsauchen]